MAASRLRGDAAAADRLWFHGKPNLVSREVTMSHPASRRRHPHRRTRHSRTTAAALTLLVPAIALCPGLAAADSEGRHEVLDAGARNEVRDAGGRDEVLDAGGRDEVLEAGRRQEVLDADRRDERLDAGARREVP
jgi:hypothetical protein